MSVELISAITAGIVAVIGAIAAAAVKICSATGKSTKAIEDFKTEVKTQLQALTQADKEIRETQKVHGNQLEYLGNKKNCQCDLADRVDGLEYSVMVGTSYRLTRIIRYLTEEFYNENHHTKEYWGELVNLATAKIAYKDSGGNGNFDEQYNSYAEILRTGQPNLYEKYKSFLEQAEENNRLRKQKSEKSEKK